jgi:Zn-dependent M28 family amino/carboxypeptidase
MIDRELTVNRLYRHLEALTRTIGERSVRYPGNLDKTSDYLVSFYEGIGVPVRRQVYEYGGRPVSNIIAEIGKTGKYSKHYIIGAHYDSVAGTAGADDNASAVAVKLETARAIKKIDGFAESGTAVTFVSFALEEPPVYGTKHMGSRVYAKKARDTGMQIDGMICLEMVGYTCHEPGCQSYPFPLGFFGYPDTGDFIGVVANFKSRGFASSLVESFRKNPELPVVSLSVPFDGRIMPAIRLSDHASFWDKGFKAVMVTDSAFYRNPHYHLSSDTMETLDYDFMAQLVRSFVIFFEGQEN